MADDGGFEIATAFVRVTANDDGLQADIEAKVKAASAGIEAKIRAVAETEGVAEEVKAAAKAADSETTIKVKVEGEGEATFEEEFAKAMAEGEAVSQRASASLRQSFVDVENASRTVRAAFEDAGGGAEDAAKKLDDAKKAATDSKSAWEVMKDGASNAANMLRQVAMAAGISLIPAFSAIPALGAAAGASFLTMALGLGGVVKALREAVQAQDAMGQSGAQLALTNFTNAVAIRNATQAVTDAKRQQTQQEITSAEQIANAQRGVTDAVRQSAISQQNAIDSVTQARQRYQQALVSEAQAQRDLTLAPAAAANQIADLNNANADAALQSQAAQLALQQAIRDNTAMQNNDTATPLQKQQALLAIAQATQAVKDAQQRATEAQQAATRANAEGVTGLPSVVSAQQQLRNAVLSTADAQHAVVVAQRDAANQEITSAEQIANAQRSLADAQRSADQQRITSTEAVTKAVQALADLQEQQKLAAAAAAASSNAAASMFARDYARLTPAGKAFVDQILSMRTELHQLEGTAQTAMLPGFTQLLRVVAQSGPQANGIVRLFGSTIGALAVSFANLLRNPAFQGALGTVLREAAGLVQQLGAGFQQLFFGMVTAGAKAAPIVAAVGSGLQQILGLGLPAFFSGVVSGGQGTAQAISSIASVISGLLGPLGTLVGALSGALGPALQILAPVITQTATQIVQALLPYMPQLSQAFVEAAQAVAQLAPLLAPLIGMMAGQFLQTLQIVLPLIKGMATFFNENRQWLVPLIGVFVTLITTIETLSSIVEAARTVWAALTAIMEVNPVILIIGAIAALAAGVIYAWDHFAGFRDFLEAMWRGIEIGFGAFLGFVKAWWPELLAPFTLGLSEIVGRWNTIVDFIKQLPQRLETAGAHMFDWIGAKVAAAADWVSRTFGGWIDDVKKLPGKLAAAGAGMWDWISGAFKTAINTVIGWWDSLSFGIPKVHIPGTDIDVGGGSIGVPYITPFAATGADVKRGGVVRVGERGAEDVYVPTEASIKPYQPPTGARQLRSPDAGTGANVQIHYHGTQHPTPEQMQIMRRDLASAVR